MTQTAVPAADRPTQAAKRYIYAWGGGAAEGDATMRDLLGGKGAGLAEMTNAGLPVPPGFTITTEACNDYFTAGEKLPDGLWDDVLVAVKEVEARTGKGFGDAADPLLVSVRSGAKFSMPGMMDTVLNLGLNEQTLHGLIALTGNERFGWDAYRRFIQMFGRIVMDVKGERFDHALDAAKERHGAKQDTDLDAAALREVVEESKRIVREDTGRDFPSDPYEQLDLAIKAVFASWFGKRAVDYRNNQKIAHDLGTAVNVVTMVFGNMGDDSGTGVAFTRDPNTGEKVLFGEYLTNAQGEDVVAGIRTAPKISQMQTDMPAVYAEFQRIGQQLEKHYRDVQDLEFTIERGKLYMLQTRSAKRTAAAAVKIAVDMVDEGLITKEEALGRIEPAHVDQLLRDQFDPKARAKATAPGQGPERLAGRRRRPAVFDADTAVEWVGRGERVILVRIETSPDDFHGMAVAAGHPDRPRRRHLPRRRRRPPDRQAVRRRLPRARSSTTRPPRRTARRGRRSSEGDWISLDGVDRRGLPRRAADRVAPGSRTSPSSRRSSAGPTRSAGCRSGPTPTSPRRPPRPGRYGAQGIGLCRTEHMFREGERLEIVRGAILVANVATRAKAKAAAGGTADRRGGRGGHDVRRRDGQARGPPAGRLRGHLPGDGRPAGRHPPDRPAAPRVPAEPRGAAGQGHQGRRRRHRGGHGAARDDQVDARAEPDARPARLPPRA